MIVKNISGFTMKCIAYRNSMDIDVEFLDGNCCIVKNVQWNNFIRGKVKNGKIGKVDIPVTDKDGKITKEYYTWHHMLERCYDNEIKNKKPTYKNVTCCDEWLVFGNFYKWLHEQENFETWKNLKWSAIDKDIIFKGNKIYSPDTCFLVPANINTLFVKCDAARGDQPIGVIFANGKYRACCTNPFEDRLVHIGTFDTKEEAFWAYKEYKENLIKQVADIEYKNNTITEKCRDAMYSYKVEVND